MYIQINSFKGAWKLNGAIYVLRDNSTINVYLPLDYDTYENMCSYSYAKKAFFSRDKVFTVCGPSSYPNIGNSFSDFIVYNNTLYHVNCKLEPTLGCLALIQAIDNIEGAEQIPTSEIALIRITATCNNNVRTLIESEGSVFSSFNDIIRNIGVGEIFHAATLRGTSDITDLFFTLGDRYFCGTTTDGEHIGLGIEPCAYEKYTISRCEISGRLYTSYRFRKVVSEIDGKEHYFAYDIASEIGWTGDYQFDGKYAEIAKELLGYTGFRYCSNCGTTVGIVDIAHNNGAPVVCDKCYDNGYRVCCSCRNTFNIHDLGPSTESYINGNWYCEDCNPNIPTLPMRNYGYKPEPKFVVLEDEVADSNTVFAGVELEVGDCCSARALRRSVASNLTEEQRGFVYPKHDGSLCSEGVEFVTHPMTRKYHLESTFWDNICAGIYDAEGDNDSAGLHIHISRKPLTYEQQSRIIYFVNKYSEFFKDFSRRHATEFRDWCSFKNYDSTECTHETKAQMAKFLEEEESNRYSSVNDCNDNTIEFRFFKAFYDPSWIRACVDLVYSIVDLAISIPDLEPFEKTPNDLYPFFRSKDTNTWCINAGYDLSDAREWETNDFIEPVKLTNKLNMIPGETYVIRSNIQYGINSPLYSRFDYNHEWYAYRWAHEHNMGKITFLASTTDAEGNSWFAFHMSSRLSPSERWNSASNINDYPAEFVEKIRNVTAEHNWDEAARVIILHDSEFKIYSI